MRGDDNTGDDEIIEQVAAPATRMVLLRAALVAKMVTQMQKNEAEPPSALAQALHVHMRRTTPPHAADHE